MFAPNKPSKSILVAGLLLIALGAPVFIWAGFELLRNGVRFDLIGSDISSHVLLLVILPSFFMAISGVLSVSAWKGNVSAVWALAALVPDDIAMAFWVLFFVAPSPAAGIFSLPGIGVVVVAFADVVLLKHVIERRLFREERISG